MKEQNISISDAWCSKVAEAMDDRGKKQKQASMKAKEFKKHKDESKREETEAQP